MGKDAEPSDEEKVDIAELAEQAKVIAKATGRTEEDVMEDLLDDGIVNMSNEQKQDKDLVTQLKEAAELITTVQQVNKEVSENSVLNGGENKTDVKIETTLEGDIVDRAIESVQRKADNIKKLMATLIPVLLIFTGGSLEAFGVTNMFGGDDDSEVTYDDDCSIWFHETWYEWVDDGTDPPDLQFHLSADTDCETPQYINFGVELNAWGYENTESARVSLDEPPVWVVIGFGDVDGPDDPNYHLADLRIYDDGGDWDQTFMDVWKTIEKVWGCTDPGASNYNDAANEDDGSCEYPPEKVYGCTDDEANNYNDAATDDDGSCEYDPEPVPGCTDPEAQNFDDEATEDDGSCTYPPPEPCEVEIHNHYRGHLNNDASSDDMVVGFKVQPSNCEYVFIVIEIFQNGYAANYSYNITVAGDEDTDVTHTFYDVAPGTSWIPKIMAFNGGELKEEVYFWALDIAEQTCEINLFGIEIEANNTSATIQFDLDCGYSENDFDGYNVSVQFLVYHVNESNSGPNATGPIKWTTDLYYIQGYADDVRTLSLDNFTDGNTTNYDFYWYAIWEDADGNQQYIERTWLDQEIPFLSD